MSLTSLVAALSAAAALWLVETRPAHVRVSRLTLDLPTTRASPPPSGARRRPGALGRGVVTLGLLAGVLVGCGVPFAVVLAACLVAAVVLRLRSRARSRRRRRRTHTDATAACEALAAELAAGLPAVMAVDRVATDFAVLAPVAGHLRLGADPATAFAAAARRPGAEGLRDVGAAWVVSSRSGAGLAAVLDRVVDALRARDDLVREVEATLGPARATARLLAVLPALALGLGVLLGGNPLAFLLGGGAGSWCLVAGVVLACAGVLWVERLTDGAAR